MLVRNDSPFTLNVGHAPISVEYVYQVPFCKGNEVIAKKHRREEISDIKFSPNGRWLAVGSHDNFIDVYDTTRSYKRVAGPCKLIPGWQLTDAPLEHT